MSEIIDSYRYCNSYDRDKMNYYEKHKYTKSEKEKTNLIREKILTFEKEINQNDKNIGIGIYPQERIEFFNDIGYISFVNEDRDIIDVCYYGRDENEALINGMIEYEFLINQELEHKNRSKFNKEYSERFLDGKIIEDEYHGPFFFAELALKSFREYFGGIIPTKIVKYYEEYLYTLEGINYKYDYETNGLILENDLIDIKD